MIAPGPGEGSPWRLFESVLVKWWKDIPSAHKPGLLALFVGGLLVLGAGWLWGTVPPATIQSLLPVAALLVLLVLLTSSSRRLGTAVFNGIALLLAVVFAAVTLKAYGVLGEDGLTVDIGPRAPRVLAVRAVVRDATTGADQLIRAGSVIVAAGASYAERQNFDQSTGVARFTNMPADLDGPLEVTPDVDGYSLYREPTARPLSWDPRAGLITLRLVPNRTLDPRTSGVSKPQANTGDVPTPKQAASPPLVAQPPGAVPPMTPGVLTVAGPGGATAAHLHIDGADQGLLRQTAENFPLSAGSHGISVVSGTCRWDTTITVQAGSSIDLGTRSAPACDRRP